LQGDGRELTSFATRAEAFLRAILGAGARHVLLPGYDLYLWSRADPFYRTIALPRDGSAADPTVIGGLIRAFARHDREPRLEFFEERWPDLREALAGQGLPTEARSPVMVWRACRSAPPDGVRFLDATSTDADINRFLAALINGFGYPEKVHASEVTRLAGLLQRDEAICAWTLQDDRPLAGATIVHLDGCGELQGVWVDPDGRRQGLATAVCQAVLARFAEIGGALAWLSAGDAASEQLYAKLGFRSAGYQVRIARPRAADGPASLDRSAGIAGRPG